MGRPDFEQSIGKNEARDFKDAYYKAATHLVTALALPFSLTASLLKTPSETLQYLRGEGWNGVAAGYHTAQRDLYMSLGHTRRRV